MIARSTPLRRLFSAIGALALIAVAMPAAPVGAAAPGSAPALAGADAGPLPAPAAAGGRNDKAYFTLVVNGVRGGDVLVILRTHDVLVQAEAMRQVGLRITPERTVRVDDEDFVSLAALRDALTYDVNEDGLKLTITASPGLFEKQQVTLATEDRHIVPGVPSGGGFLNYQLQTGSGSRRLGGTGQFGVAVGRGVAEVTLSEAVGRSGYRFANAAYTIDDVVKARRFVLGAATIDANDFAGLGGSAIINGLSVRHDATLDPSSTRRYGDGFAGVATTASTVDVYVNGSLVREETIGPGPFAITNIPLQTGVNQTTVVVRDALGNVQRLGRPDYIGLELLGRGQRAYDFGVGRPATVTGAAGSGPLFAGRYEVGISNAVTLSARGSVDANVTNLGAGVGFGTRFGEFGVLAAASRARRSAGSDISLIDLAHPSDVAVQPFAGAPGDAASRVAGAAYALTYGFLSRRYSVRASMVRQSDHYASMSLAPLQDRVTADDRVVARYEPERLGGLQVSADLERLAYRDAPPVRQLQLQLGRTLGRETSMFVGVGRRALGAVSGATWSFGFSSTFHGVRIGTTSSSAAGAHSVAIDVSKLTSGELGTSTQAEFSNGDRGAATTINYERRMPFGTLNLYSTLGQGSNAVQAVLNGSVAYAARSWFFSRPVQDGFGVVDVGVPGVEAMVNGESVGTTDARGKLFIPTLSALYASPIELKSSTLPDNVVFETIVGAATPRYRSGTVIRFPARTLNAFTGSVRFDDDHAKGPTYGRLFVHTASGDRVSDIGLDGEFYFDGVPPGAYDATAKYAGGECVLRLTFPAGTGSHTKLGTLYCRRETK
ncbi:MAG TPA: fimbria/pilus outer membrane usher protein [Candidatus Limnocylindrales bacterium]|nr:fimbria/pilus outer membrane usher protein [Candidatus Limnocylindrales bacterium]